ncbi:MAG: KpsF/GutQ family sugar-phosphate isomerase [Bacteroidia bacterium]
MLTDSKILEIAKETIRLESESVAQLGEKIDSDFTQAVRSILDCEGRVVITGIGKSAIIGQKIVATLNSTGTASMFMHAADAIHGDLGMIRKSDVVLCISKSGNSPEIRALIPLLKQSSNVVIGMTGDLNSELATKSDIVLDTTVSKEACPNNLAPTTSTTVQLVMGDALAVVLLSCRDFSEADFAKYHPGGALGKKIYLRIADIAVQNAQPIVNESTPLNECIIKITEGRMGAAIVLNNQEVKGIITDGDLRRMLTKTDDLKGLTAIDVMTPNPLTIASNALAVKGVELINENKINHLIAVDNEQFVGIVHIQDLMREGLL